MNYSTAHIDYVGKSFLDDYEGIVRTKLTPEHVAQSPPEELALLRISEVGRSWRPASTTGSPDTPLNYHSEDLLVGSFGIGAPMLFAVIGDAHGVRVVIGTFSGSIAKGGAHHQQTGALEASVMAHYPGSVVETVPGPTFQATIGELVGRGHLGILTGVPTRKPALDSDGTTQIDRVIRSMRKRKWAWVVLADPLAPGLAHDLRNSAINEMRNVEDAEQVNTRRSPLADAYMKQLEALRDEYDEGLAFGTWATSAYFLAEDRATFDVLGATLSSAFGGERSRPEPVRVLEVEHTRAFTSGLGQIMLGTAEPPGDFEHPYGFQTILSSARLAALVHVPRLEVPGLVVREHRRFDVVPPKSAAKGPIELGQVMDEGRSVGQRYRLSRDALNKHALVVGVTGSGKTKTVIHLLRQAWAERIPWLVLEPAKTEYRELIADPTIGPDLRVFTLGEETVSPFRMNPFEVIRGASILTHIDLLKATFNASFAMWSPLPQVLERCVHEVYRDCGWDIVRGTNRRLPADASPKARALTFPTLSDLSAKVEAVVDGLGYEARVTSDIKAALLTRLDSLRIGGKGAMLDVQTSIPIEDLLAGPTVIELEQVGDDDEKAFLMGLLLIRIYEHLRATASTSGAKLRHMVVIEEAHRLLANVGMGPGEEQANTRAKAVESFVNMLSEVRAYGQGFVVAEQIPAKLAPDVLKNTNVKIVHRTVAGDDRQAVAQTMNMDDEQSFMLATFRPGLTAVFSEGDDRPLIVEVPFPLKLALPEETKTKIGSNRWVADHMGSYQRQPNLARLFVPFVDCASVCSVPYAHCDTARGLIESRRSQELITAVVLAAATRGADVPAALERFQGHLAGAAAPGARVHEALGCIIRNAVRWYFRRYGKAYDWPLDAVAEAASMLPRILTKIVLEGVVDDEALASFRAAYARLDQSGARPFERCPSACPSGACTYRYQVSSLLRDSSLTELFDFAMRDATGADGWTDHRALLRLEERLTSSLPPHAARSASLCYGLQQIALKPGLLHTAEQLASDALVEGYDATHSPRVTE